MHERQSDELGEPPGLALQVAGPHDVAGRGLTEMFGALAQIAAEDRTADALHLPDLIGGIEDDRFAHPAALEHPLKADFEAVRKTLLSADKSISDGVKWNALSFRTTEWFATVNLRSQDTVQLIMHLGAKPGKQAPADAIPDTKGLLKWLGKDRAMATLGSGAQLKANLPALKAIAKAWIRHV